MKDGDGLTSLAAANNLFLISATEGDLDGPACGLSFPGVGFWKTKKKKKKKKNEIQSRVSGDLELRR